MLPENLIFKPHEVSSCVFTVPIEILELNSKRSFKSCIWTMRSCGKWLTDTGGDGTSSCPWASDKALWSNELQLVVPLAGAAAASGLEDALGTALTPLAPSPALQGCLRCVTNPLSEHPWVIQAPSGWNLCVLGVVFERNKVNEWDKLQYFKN